MALIFGEVVLAGALAHLLGVLDGDNVVFWVALGGGVGCVVARDDCEAHVAGDIVDIWTCYMMKPGYVLLSMIPLALMIFLRI